MLGAASTPAKPAATPRRPRRRLGKAGLAYFKELLGGPPVGWELETASFGDLSLEFALVKGPRRLELEISRDRADGVRLSTRGPVENMSDEERALMRSAGEAAAATRFSDLIARLSRDSLLYTDPQGSSVPSRFESYYRRVDHSSDFWKFVHPQARFLEQEISFGARYAKISHATLECRLNNPQLTVAPLRFFSDEPSPRSQGDDCSYTDTAISEADVLAGRTQQLLGRALESVARDEKPAFIHLKTTCLPELVGDNPSSFIEALAKEPGVPVLWTSKTRDPGPMYGAMLERILDGVRFLPERDSRAVILAGIPAPEAGREAAEMLSGLGLRVVGSLFPSLDFKQVPDLGSASAVVWLNPVGWEKIDDGMFLRRGLAVVRHHPPFGLAGSRAWLERVASVLELGGVEKPWARIQAASSGALEALRAECGRRTVSLAGDAADVELLTSAGRAFGFSVAGLLCELGFHVRCLVRDAGAGARTLRRARVKLGAGSIEFVPFSTRGQLDRELGRGIDLVFSHFNRDPRLEAHGVLGFTDRSFETGIEGLIRTGRLLQARCGARPFPRHRACLSPWT